MATLDEKSRDILNKFTNPEGKLIVTDDMSDDLKEAIEYINENNLDIFNTDLEEEPLLSDEELDSLENEEEYQEDLDESNELGPFEELEPFDESELIETLDDSEVEELGKFI
ncbi:MAG: hypothetical protein IKF91_06135 [Bacilli bacterium]|nr:hypothetical protein [Bacilli bacterium]